MKKSLSYRDLSLAGALLAITLFFPLHPDGGAFLSAQNLSNLSIEFAITATLALGMLLVLLPGMIDLSVGSGVGMIGGLACVLVTFHSWPAPLAMLAAFVAGAIVWAAMGTLITRQNVPAFIITLGGLLVFQGIHWLIIENSTVPVAPGGSDNLFSLLTTYYLPQTAGYVLFVLIAVVLALLQVRGRRARQSYGFELEDKERAFLKLFVGLQALLLLTVVMNLHRGLPLPLLILGVVAVVVVVVTRHTPMGRYLYAIGGNEEAAILSGVPIVRVITGAYLLLGLIVALTGLMQTAYGGYTTTTVGKLMELDAIAACVIGGTSLKGGRGTVIGVLIGSLIMAVLLNGMTLLAVSPEIKFIARGVVLVLAVWMDVWIWRKR